MRRTSHYFAIGFMLVVTLSKCACADELPQFVSNSLQQREGHLNHLAFEWHFNANITAPPSTAAEVSVVRKTTEIDLPVRLRKSGVTDENTIRKAVDRQVREITSDMVKGYSVNSSTPCRFEHDGDTTLVTGLVKEANLLEFRQFYNKMSGLIVNDKNVTTNGTKLPTYAPVAWGSPGASICYLSPFQNGLRLTPEDFVMLMGANPLAMYGLHWKLLSTTPSTWILGGQVDTGNNAPFTINMTLDREHNGIPSLIKIKGVRWESQFHAMSYKRYNDEWIADKVSFNFDLPGLQHRSQVWTLQSIHPCKSIAFALPPSRLVGDYRLLGQNLTTGDVLLNITKQQAAKIVYYPWTGQFPSVEELKKLQRQHNPGESTPDLSKSSSALPFIGGLLCLVGGVWMFKQRGMA